MLVDFDERLASLVYEQITTVSRMDIISGSWSDDHWNHYEMIRDNDAVKSLTKLIVVGDEPLMLVGVVPVMPGVCQSWCVARECSAVKPLSVVRDTIEAQRLLSVTGCFHRVFTYCRESCYASKRFARATGYIKEAVLKGYSKFNEDVSVWRLESDGRV